MCYSCLCSQRLWQLLWPTTAYGRLLTTSTSNLYHPSTGRELSFIALVLLSIFLCLLVQTMVVCCMCQL